MNYTSTNRIGALTIGLFIVSGIIIGVFAILFTGNSFTDRTGTTVIGLLGLAGGLTGAVITSYYEKKKLKLEEPDVIIEYITGSYKLSKYGSKNSPGECKDNILLNLKIKFKNNSKSMASITDLIVQVKYNEEVQLHNYRQIFNHAYERLLAERLSNPTSVKLDPYCGAEAEYKFEFKNVNFISLQRCLESINIRNPRPNKKWDDLPLYIKIIAKAPTNNIEGSNCVYREDQEESKKIGGPLDYEDFK